MSEPSRPISTDEQGVPADMKSWIDNASYESLLDRWRHAPVGSPWFQGSVGDYYSKVMATRRAANPGEHVRASKSIGWGS